jgi:hypothetical protein
MAGALDPICRILASQSISVASAGGASASAAVFGSQTYAVELSHNNSAGGMRFVIADVGGAVSSTQSAYLPPLWVSHYKVTPGQRVIAIGDGATTGTMTIVELTK